MKAIALTTGTSGVRLVELIEPAATFPDDVKVRILRVGICGTDREEVSGGRALAPNGKKELVIGHEMFGQVVETETSVTRVKLGDHAVFTVRRGCGNCLPCLMNRSDMCLTGNYRERGIWGLDGYQTEYVVDKEQYIVHVPEDLKSVGVLTEPLSVAEKAIDDSVRIQSARLPEAAATPNWLFGRRCLVAGLGPIGLLAALALRLRDVGSIAARSAPWQPACWRRRSSMRRHSLVYYVPPPVVYAPPPVVYAAPPGYYRAW